MDIGKRIRHRREELNMTQDELAKKMGYASRSSVNKVENAEEVSMKKVKAYAEALDTTVPILMGWSSLNAKNAKTDIDLSNMEDKLKAYALKLSKLPKEKQQQIMSLIDMLEDK